MSKYQPEPNVLNKYADVLVNFALNSGAGVKKGGVVFVQIPESAKPLLIPLQNTILKSGGHPLIQYLPDNIQKDFFQNASREQITFFPQYFLKGRVDQADHFLTIIAETDLHEMENIDPELIMTRRSSMKPYIDWRNQKENEGRFTWTLGLYATPAMAAEAGLSLKSCWQQIINACFLDKDNPISEWRNAQKQINLTKNKLDHLDIKKIHLTSQKTDLWIGLDRNRRWLGGDGRNVPSFEVFITPDWRATEGNIFFDQPLYRDGNLIKDIYLEFHQGKVIKFTASPGQKVIEEMLKVKDADKIGEFSLTDKRLSRINKFMAETLYDENFGGKYGNTHIALGSSFKESYPGEISSITTEQWQDMGYNDSVIHTDLISTRNRTVTATLSDNSEITIFKNGIFLI